MRFDNIKRSTVLTVVLGAALAFFAALPISAFGKAGQPAPTAQPPAAATPDQAAPAPPIDRAGA